MSEPRIASTYHPTTGELFLSFTDTVLWLRKLAEQDPVIDQVAEMLLDLAKDIPLSTIEATPEMTAAIKVAQADTLQFAARNLPDPCSHDLAVRWLSSVAGMVAEEIDRDIPGALSGQWIKEDT